MRMGSSIPNFTRSAARTSGGILVLAASSPNGSPGASASRTKSTRLIPRRLGTAMIRRLRTYFPIVVPPSPVQLFRIANLTSGSCVPVPVRKLPQVVVPAADMRGQIAADGRDPRTANHGQDIIVADDQVVELDVHRRPLHRIEFLFGLFESLVVFLALPAADIASLPLVLLVRHLP